MGQDWASAANQLRQAQMQETMGLRNQPINEIMALLGGSGVTVPQFQPYSRQGINAAPTGSYIGQNYANQANAAAQFNQGLFGLGGAGLGAFGSWLGGPSDRRLKQDIEPLEGRKFAGLPLYKFRFRADPSVLQVGVMSDDVRKVHPNAVSVNADGYDMVDYGLLMRRDNNG
jgi:hypothetical protein